MDPATPSTPEESDIIDAFNASPPVVAGNPGAAAAAQEMNEEIWKGSRGSESYSPGRGMPGLYR